MSLSLLSLSVMSDRLCCGGRAAALLLPGGVLLDVSGRHSALQDGGPGLQHQLPDGPHDGCGLRSTGGDSRHLRTGPFRRIRHREKVGTFH